MSRWSYYGRRASPFSSSPNRSPPVVTDRDYTYVTSDDDEINPPAGSWGSSRQSAGYTNTNNPSEPDILIVRHRGQQITLQFPAFSIGEGFLKIRLIRQYVADKLGVHDIRRVKLRYKNRTLRDDEMPARDAGLKQNSEVICVVTEGPYDDSPSSEGEGSNPIRGPHVDVDGTIIHDQPPRANRQSTNRQNREQNYSNHSNPSTPSRNNFTPLTSTTTASTSRPAPTQTPNSSASDLRSSPSQTPAPYVPPSGPRTPRETVSDLLAVFDTKYRPLCEAFIANPPSDPKVRATEHTKLSETVLAQILLKLDDVQTDGNEAVRRLRRTAVHEAQAVLNQLDKVVGKTR